MAAATLYESLVAAAYQLQNVEALEGYHHYPPSSEDLFAYLSLNEQPLHEAARWSTADCVVPTRFDSDYFAEHGPAIAQLRNLCRAFVWRIRLVVDQQDCEAAFTCGSECLAFTNAIRRGGLLLDAQFSEMTMGSAIRLLRLLRQRLTGEQRPRWIEMLRQMEAEREGILEILARDAEYDRQVPPKPVDLGEFERSLAEQGAPDEQQVAMRELFEAFSQIPPQGRFAMSVVADHHALALLRLMIVDLMIRQFHAARGRYPASLTELWSRWERPIVDPYSERPFGYRVEPSGFKLYSVGPTGVDCGGRFGDWMQVQLGEADLCLDMSDYTKWD